MFQGDGYPLGLAFLGWNTGDGKIGRWGGWCMSLLRSREVVWREWSGVCGGRELVCEGLPGDGMD